MTGFLSSRYMGFPFASLQKSEAKGSKHETSVMVIASSWFQSNYSSGSLDLIVIKKGFLKS